MACVEAGLDLSLPSRGVVVMIKAVVLAIVSSPLLVGGSYEELFTVADGF